jgi:putative ABC transport system permease protein
MLINYLKMAWKVLLRRKYFTFASLFAITFTLIVLMTATAIMDHQFGSMPPETRLDRMMCVTRMSLEGKRYGFHSSAGYKFLNQYTRDMPGVELMSIVSSGTRQVDSYAGGRKFVLHLRHTDGEFWKMMEFTFLEGGGFSALDEKEANPVAVINQATREKIFGGQPAVGKSVSFEGRSFRVTGVVASVPFFRQLSFADVWVPISTSSTDFYRTQLVGNFWGLYLARGRADFSSIRKEFSDRIKAVEIPQKDKFSVLKGEIETYSGSIAQSIGGSEAGFYAIIAFLAVLFMILPTLNLVNINISRIMERASEIGVRKAFGASSRTLVFQFVTENVLLTLIGGALGFAGAILTLRLVTHLEIVPYADFHMNLRVFSAQLAITLFFGVFSGVYPAWRMSRLHPIEALRGGMR